MTWALTEGSSKTCRAVNPPWRCRTGPHRSRRRPPADGRSPRPDPRPAPADRPGRPGPRPVRRRGDFGLGPTSGPSEDGGLEEYRSIRQPRSAGSNAQLRPPPKQLPPRFGTVPRRSRCPARRWPVWSSRKLTVHGIRLRTGHGPENNVAKLRHQPAPHRWPHQHRRRTPQDRAPPLRTPPGTARPPLTCTSPWPQRLCDRHIFRGRQGRFPTGHRLADILDDFSRRPGLRPLRTHQVRIKRSWGKGRAS